MTEGYTSAAEDWLDGLRSGPQQVEDDYLDTIDWIFDDPDRAQGASSGVMLDTGPAFRTRVLGGVDFDPPVFVYWMFDAHGYPVIVGGGTAGLLY